MTNSNPLGEGLTFIDQDMLAAAEKSHVAESLAYLSRSTPAGRAALIDAACSSWETETGSRHALVSAAIQMQSHDFLGSFRRSKDMLPLSSALAAIGLNECLLAWASLPTAGAMAVGDPLSCAAGARNADAIRILEPILASPPPPPPNIPSKVKARRMGADLAQSRLAPFRAQKST